MVSPNVLEAEELVGHEFNDDEDRLIAVREMCEPGRPRGDHDAADGCFGKVQEDGSGRLYRRAHRADRAALTVGSGDAFLAGFVAARYTGAAGEECLRFGVACGAESTQPSVPASSTRARSRS